MGYLAEALELLHKLKERAERHKDYLANNEAATRASLVNPVLGLLGWDVSDPDKVQVEYKVEGKSVDYALLEGGKPAVLIEAKSFGAKLKDDFWQIALYAGRTGASLGVMTNGDEWIFLDPSKASAPQKAKFSVMSTELRECAITLITNLDRAVEPGPIVPPAPKPAPPPGAMTLRELQQHLRNLNLGKGVPNPRPKSVCFGSEAAAMGITSYADMFVAIARQYADKVVEKLPVRASEHGVTYIAASEPRHGSGRPFGSPRRIASAQGEEFYVSPDRMSSVLVAWAIRLLTVIGVDPDEVKVELA